ncbi:MAG: hypothetical protein LIP01_04335, partial [Tannerellaceae bacterium]|nr:hypothetical protein [Tannerellaceae bacterium]
VQVYVTNSTNQTHSIGAFPTHLNTPSALTIGSNVATAYDSDYKLYVKGQTFTEGLCTNGDLIPEARNIRNCGTLSNAWNDVASQNISIAYHSKTTLARGINWYVEEERLAGMTLYHNGTTFQYISIGAGIEHSDNKRLFIAANGNVGIGNANPTHKLQVEGSIASNKFVEASYSNNSSFIAKGSNGGTWNTGQPAGLQVDITNNNSQTPLLVGIRSGSDYTATGDNRLYSLELMNTGEKLRHYMGGILKYTIHKNGSLTIGSTGANTSSNQLYVEGRAQVTGAFEADSYVGLPVSTVDVQGIASYNKDHFTLNSGKVSLNTALIQELSQKGIETVSVTGTGNAITSLDLDNTGTILNATKGSTFLLSTGTAVAATKLATARTITLTGGVTGSASFDGSANASITTTVVSAPKLTTARTINGTSFDGSANITLVHCIRQPYHKMPI